jgi:chromosome segregation ATPase
LGHRKFQNGEIRRRSRASGQKEKEQQLQAVIDEQKDLEQRINAIDARIEAIKKLRSSQAGPSAVLEAMRERTAMVPGLYLESVEQKGRQPRIQGQLARRITGHPVWPQPRIL